jgi:hypothetical protein
MSWVSSMNAPKMKLNSIEYDGASEETAATNGAVRVPVGTSSAQALHRTGLQVVVFASYLQMLKALASDVERIPCRRLVHESCHSHTHRSLTASMDDTMLTLRFKHGLHTIAFPVDSTKPVSVMSAQLLQILRERYQSGTLKRSGMTEGETEIPAASDEDGEPAIYYAKPKNAEDNRFTMPPDGTIEWTAIKMKPSDTPGRLGIKTNTMLAFYFDEGDWPPPVEFPKPAIDEEEGR